MPKQIFTRTIWSFIVLADFVAFTSLLELLNPKEHDVGFVWNASWNWLSILGGMACVSLAVAAISLLLQEHLRFTSRKPLGLSS